MAEVKWIKICTDIFDDEKILFIETMPEADSLIVIWFKLLCMAGKQNNKGVFMLTDTIAYTDEMFATIFRRPVNTVRLALKTFENYGMVKIINNAVTIPNWEKHQSLDTLERNKEKTRQRVAAYREKQKLLAANDVSICQYCGAEATGFDHIIPIAHGGLDTMENKVPCCIECNRMKNDKPLVDFLNFHRERINDDLVLSNPKLNKYVTLSNVTGRYIVTLRNADRIDKNREEENRIEEDKNRDIQRACAREESDEGETENSVCKQIVELYNGTCTSLPKVTTISSARERVIKTRLKEFSVKQFQTLFKQAQASKFLTGKNKNNWRANFDWLMNATNFAKVLDGNYDDYVAPHDGMSGKPEDDLPF